MQWVSFRFVLYPLTNYTAMIQEPAGVYVHKLSYQFVPHASNI